MMTDGMTPQPEVRGSAGDGDAYLREGERQEKTIPPLDQNEMKARVDEILNRWPAVGLAVGVVRDGSLESFYGHGVADIASGTPVTENTVFRIGSISKTFTAIAVMQLWEQGLVELDAPANNYLRAFQLVPAKAGWRPATVRHLLTYCYPCESRVMFSERPPGSPKPLRFSSARTPVTDPQPPSG